MNEWIWCPVVFVPQFVDSDNLLTNRQVLTDMIAENLTIVAPMLESESLYSNFWCGVTPQVPSEKEHNGEHEQSIWWKVWQNDCYWSSNTPIGLLQTNTRIYSHSQMADEGLLCSPDGALHLPAGPEAHSEPGFGLPPSTHQVPLLYRWHHGLCFLCWASRSDLHYNFMFY